MERTVANRSEQDEHLSSAGIPPGLDPSIRVARRTDAAARLVVDAVKEGNGLTRAIRRLTEFRATYPGIVCFYALIFVIYESAFTAWFVSAPITDLLEAVLDIFDDGP